MKKLYKIIPALMTAFTALTAVPAFAEEETTEFAMYMLDDDERGSVEYDENDDEGKIDIQMEASVPDDFHMKIDVFFDRIPMGLYYDDSKENNGYLTTVPLAEGIYEVRVMSKADFADEFSYEVEPKILDTSKEQAIRIKVTPTENHYGESEDDPGNMYEGLVSDEGHDHEHDDEGIIIEPELIDLSEGKTYGVFNVSLADTVPALTSVTYSLTDGKETYPIELKRKYEFKAKVLLPIGEYYELYDMEYVLDKDAAMNDDIKTSWSHKYNRGFYGNYYTIEENNETVLNDLEVMMIDHGDVFPFDSQRLYAVTLRERKSQAIESHAAVVMESAFGETIEETTTVAPQMIAELQEVDNTFDIRDYIKHIAVGVIMVVGLIGIIIWKKNR